MKALLVLALLVAVPGSGHAGDAAVDPAPVTTATKAEEAAARAKGRNAKRGAAATPPSKQEAKDAAPKDEKPCEPVKPCPID